MGCHVGTLNLVYVKAVGSILSLSLLGAKRAIRVQAHTCSSNSSKGKSMHFPILSVSTGSHCPSWLGLGSVLIPELVLLVRVMCLALERVREIHLDCGN